MVSDPLLPPFVDLRDFRFMPLIIEQLRRSKQWLIAKRRPEVGFYSLNLWAASWHELPAGSLEDDDDVLADAAMCAPDRWPDVKDDVLRGWIRCSDGRLYHPVVCAEAASAWNDKAHHRWRKECERVRKENGKRKERGEAPIEIPAEPTPLSAALPADVRSYSAGKSRNSGGRCAEKASISAEHPQDSAPLSTASPPERDEPSGGKCKNSAGTSSEKTGLGADFQRSANGIPAENALKGQGQCKGQGQINLPAQHPVPRAPAESDRPASERPPDPGAAPARNELDEVEHACRAALGAVQPQDYVIGPMVEIVRKFGQERVSLCLASEARRPRRKPIRTWKIWARVVDETLADGGQQRPPAADGGASSERRIDLGYAGIEMPESNLIGLIGRWRKDPTTWWENVWGPPPDKSAIIRKFAEERGLDLGKVEDAA